MVVFAVMGLVLVAATDQILPATSDYQAQMRVWLAARATGIVALVALTAQVVLGIVLSHPVQARWKQGKRIYPWHESLWVFVLAFLAVHVVSLVLDPYAGVGIGGALVPGLVGVRHWQTDDGRTVHHLIDPRTGEPGGDGLTAVTVLGTDPAWAEVWSKALFLSGARGIGNEARRRGLAAWWVEADGSLHLTPAARQHTVWERAAAA